MNYSNYPAGAYSDPNAPYNQSEPETEVEVTIRETLVKVDSFVTNNAWYVTDEEGYTWLEHDDLDVQSEAVEHKITLSEVIGRALKEIAALRKKQEEICIELKNQGKRCWTEHNRLIQLRGLEADLGGWVSDELEVELNC